MHISITLSVVLALVASFVATPLHAQVRGTDDTNTVPADIRPVRPQNVRDAERTPNDRRFFQNRTTNTDTRTDAATSERRPDAVSTDKREELRERLEKRKAEVEERKEAIRTQIDERKARLQEGAADRIRAYIARIEERFEAAIRRLHRIQERIETRIETLEENRDLDLTQARSLLVTADNKLEEAQESVDLFVAEAHAALTERDDTETRVTFASIRELLQEAKQSLREAHAALVDAVAAIKANVKTTDDSDGNDRGDGVDE